MQWVEWGWGLGSWEVVGGGAGVVLVGGRRLVGVHGSNDYECAVQGRIGAAANSEQPDTSGQVPGACATRQPPS